MFLGLLGKRPVITIKMFVEYVACVCHGVY